MSRQKMRKMLGDVNSPECVSLMRLMETQSKATLSAWAVGYAKTRYLPLYAAQFPKDVRFQGIIAACEGFLRGECKLADVKPRLKEALQIARDAEENPAGQAAARALSTACAAVQTPANALGFLFYGAAAVAYGTAGLEQDAAAYDAMALSEFRQAYASLQQAAVPDEPAPAKINWNC